jgi:hypothetical protein
MLYRDLAGLPLTVRVPWTPTALGWLAVLVFAVLSALPPALRLMRTPPRDLLAAGRGGA